MTEFKDRSDILNNTATDLCPACKKLKGTEARTCDTCLEYLNYARMMIQSGVNQDNKSVQAGAIVTLHYFLDVAKMDIGQIYQFQKRLEALAAEVSAIHTSLKVKARIPDASKAEKSGNFTKAVNQQKLDNAPTKDKKILTQRDKAIQALVNIGLYLEVATAKVDEKMAEQGRVTGLEKTADELKKG